MAYTEQEFIAGPNDAGRRIDRIVKAILPEHSLSLLYRMLRSGDIRLNGKRTKPDVKLSASDRIQIRLNTEAAINAHLASGEPNRHQSTRLKPDADASVTIVWSSHDIVVFNKPRGMLSHGPGGLDELASRYLAGSAQGSLAFKPAPLHRLDRNTSGAIAVSASMAGAQAFSEQLLNGLVGKWYLALLGGMLPAEIRMEDRLIRDSDAGITRRSASMTEPLNASMNVFPLSHGQHNSQPCTLVAIQLETGLTHQIRAQCSLRAFALLGDSKYGGMPLAGGYILHCTALSCVPVHTVALPALVSAPLSEPARLTIDALCGKGCAASAYAWICEAAGRIKKF